jgi:hypothetical protein
VSNAPAHRDHQNETNREEDQSGDTVLNTDDFVIGAENVFLKERKLVVVMIVMPVGMIVVFCVGGCTHGLVFSDEG